LLFGPLTGLPSEAFDSIEPNCDGALVRNNLVVFNGLGASNPLVPSADLFWDGTGTDPAALHIMFSSAAWSTAFPFRRLPASSDWGVATSAAEKDDCSPRGPCPFRPRTGQRTVQWVRPRPGREDERIVAHQRPIAIGFSIESNGPPTADP